MAAGIGIVTLGGMLLVVFGWMGLVGRLPRNGLAGIRTPYTMRSDENWYATHRAAAPLLIFGGVAIFMAGLAFFPFTIAGKISTGLASAVTIALVVVLFIDVIAAWQFGVHSARSSLHN